MVHVPRGHYAPPEGYKPSLQELAREIGAGCYGSGWEDDSSYSGQVFPAEVRPYHFLSGAPSTPLRTAVRATVARMGASTDAHIREEGVTFMGALAARVFPAGTP